MVKARLEQLDGLRALAILLVFNVHFFGALHAKDYLTTPASWLYSILGTLHAGYIGVDLFFIISGFLIYKNLVEERNLNFSIFFKKRLKRLYPAFLITVLIYFFRYYRTDITGLLYNVTFAAPLFKHVTNFNSVTWSLLYEWIFYVAAFFFIKNLKTKFEGDQLLNKYLIFGTIFCFLISLVWLIPQDYFIIPDADRMLNIFIGASLYKIGSKHSSGRYDKLVFSLLMLLTLVLCYVCSQFLPVFSGRYLNLGYFLLAGVVLFYIIKLALRNNFSILKNDYLVGLGKISYSFYLIHQLIIYEVKGYFNPQTQEKMWFTYFFTLILTIIISKMFYQLFEAGYFNSRKKEISAP